ncbi:MAG: histidine kinase [Burkholderiales bacterium]|nr:histidine kinase [Burkholderiales bacterium]
MHVSAIAAEPPLDAPLPVELVGSRHGWFTGYRRYPVFSPTWVRGRLRLTGTVIACVLVPLVTAVWNASADSRPYGALVQVVVHLLLPCLLTPWLASMVRRRHWAAAREWQALVAVLVLTVASMAAFSLWGAEPVKQWLAERTGTVNADGSRKVVVLSVGVTVAGPDSQATSAAASASDSAGASHTPGGDRPSDWDPTERLVNTVLWAVVAYLLGGGVALSGWRRERTGLRQLQQERDLQRAQAERREAELRLSVLAAQVEPHFLFNTLAGVRSAIATDPARASEMIDRLVDYLRASIPRLRTDGSAQATLGGQLDMVRAYLGLMAARMPRLHYSVQAPAHLLTAPCPPWMLISLVENAVKHGIEPKIGSAHIEVTARCDDDGALAIHIADDGVGFGGSTSGTGLGLGNIRERLQQLHQGRASLTLRARAEGGVEATITLPPDPAVPRPGHPASEHPTPDHSPAMP